MREILFRGFHPDENGNKTITLNGEKIKGEWVEGDLIQTHLEYSNGKKEIDYEIRTRTIGIDLDSFDGGYMAGSENSVIPETVRQYTGLTDKNGNRIFEGDIVQSEEYQQGDEVGEIVYGSKDCTYWVHSEKYDWWLMLDEADWEIIGNIHENAELLEVEK